MAFVTHTFEAFYNHDSEILILGSMPSVKSRELGFYYMHPKNRFWLVLSMVFQEEVPSSIHDKKDFLKRNKIALWDVIKTCSINGSSDASIKNVKVNDIASIIKKSNIKRIYTTGKKAHELYYKYCYKDTLMDAVCLYSPSCANCKYSINDLVDNYKKIKTSQFK